MMPAVDLAPFARALLAASNTPPPGLMARAGGDLASRFAVYRNNVAASLRTALADSFPVLRQVLGAEFFDAMALAFLRSQPPRSPRMVLWGEALPAWLAAFEPAACVPYAAALARLEWLRLRALHAADQAALPAAQLAAKLADVSQLANARFALHPALGLVGSTHAVVSLWAAHQELALDDDLTLAERLASIHLAQPETALVLRPADEVLVVLVDPATAQFVAALEAGHTLGDAAATLAAEELPAAVALLLRHGVITGWS